MKHFYFKKNHAAFIGLLIIIFFIFIAIMSIFWTPFDPLEMNFKEILQAPCFKTRHFMGTDQFGRDILSRIIYGSRISLGVSFSATFIAATFGVLMGIWAGFLGGIYDNCIMRINDILFSFPPLLLAIFIMGVLGENTYNVIIAIGIVYIPQFARISRAAILAIKNLEFVEAASAIGGTRNRILFKHLLPNIIPCLIVQTSLCLSLGILLESSLSFLGLGVQPPFPSWGNILGDARRFIIIAPWSAIFPGLTIILIVIGFNLLGDGLRDILDPRLKNVR
ncbi:ABC transporter permease [bacterium]|nr:ABC transporter permease [bacterium]MBU4510627.1 ABC transporter permease [bacterium]PKP61783.1 MAG: glutathione ABC transporter permease GsiD [Candidatus Atribacteria bacterium HGW-Atribacteria-1]